MTQGPVLFFYASDTTPLSTSEAFARKFGQANIRRRGRRSADLLVQRAFLLNSVDEARVLLDEARSLANKSAWCRVYAARRFVDLPRACGRHGVVCHHCVWGRAVQSARERRARQLHAALYMIKPRRS